MKKRSLLPVLLAVTLFPGWMTGQTIRRCVTTEHMDLLKQKNPGLIQNLEQIDENARLRAKLFSGRPIQVVKIPVVVHVIYNRGEENISDEQILSQIEVLNQDFRRKNPDADLTPFRFQQVAADTELEFVLANVDPQGNPSTGITRTRTRKESFVPFSDEMKYAASGGVNAWPSTDYLNIWVCNMDVGVLGFAQFPGGPRATDGVVIGHRYFGTSGLVNPPFNKGRTTTHEVGHWLNLRHVWGDKPCGDDLVEDTPPSEGPHHGCVRQDSTCGTPDMVQNYMDYTDDACMNMFTRGQKFRMRALFAPGGFRHSILTSRGYQEERPRVCGAPLALSATEITEADARISWTPVPDADGYLVRMRRLPDGQWKTRRTDDHFTRVIRLFPCTDYEFQVKTACGFGDSEFSASTVFRTLGCSQGIPANLIAKSIRPNTATLLWDPVPDAQGYEVQFVRAGRRDIESKRIKANELQLGGLLPNSLYYFRVRAYIQDRFSPFSQAFSFTTAGSSKMVARSASPVVVYLDEAQQYIHLEPTDELQGEIGVRLLDDSGGLHYEKQRVTLATQRVNRIHVKGLRPGKYTLYIEDASGFEFPTSLEIGSSGK